MAALRAGDRDAFAYLYDNYSAALYGILNKMLRDEAAAEDLLQEAFVKIWRNLPKYDSTKGRLFTWLLNVTRNLAIDRMRSRSFGEAKQTSTLESTQLRGSGDGEIIASPDVAIVRARIAQMKPEHRAPLELVYFSGYTQAEAAEALEVPLGTIKTRLRTALQQLRGELGE